MLREEENKDFKSLSALCVLSLASRIDEHALWGRFSQILATAQQSFSEPSHRQSCAKGKSSGDKNAAGLPTHNQATNSP